MLFFHNGLLASSDLEIKIEPRNKKRNTITSIIKKKPIEIPILKRNELRLRRDLESLIKLVSDLKTNISWIRG